jgi:hypothetical protein
VRAKPKLASMVICSPEMLLSYLSKRNSVHSRAALPTVSY